MVKLCGEEVRPINSAKNLESGRGDYASDFKFITRK
jgi:hypothetical protein